MNNKQYILWQLCNLILFAINLFIGFHGIINPLNLIVAGFTLGVAICAHIARAYD